MATVLAPFPWQSLSGPVIGVDEAGRGCLAGPVVAAAVVLNTDADFSEYTDSKLLSARRREELANHIKTHHRYGLGFATVSEIYELNILWASLLAMRRAIEQLGLPKAQVLIDGNKTIPDLSPTFEQTALIKGELRAEPIAAASILAKVARDKHLHELAKLYPQYGFEVHKGYGTAEHRSRIQRYGPCPEHRLKFAGVAESATRLRAEGSPRDGVAESRARLRAEGSPCDGVAESKARLRAEGSPCDGVAESKARLRAEGSASEGPSV